MNHTTVQADTNSLAGYTLRMNTPVIATDLLHETRFRIAALQFEHQIISSASVIVHGRDHPFGVLSVDTARRRTFTDDDVHFLEAIAHVITAALERKAFEHDLLIERDAAEHLAELDRLRREFIGSVSHDLRTPLTAVQAGMGLIASSAGDRLTPAERQILNNVRRNGERLRALIDDLLTLNQVEAGAGTAELRAARRADSCHQRAGGDPRAHTPEGAVAGG